MQEFDSGPPAPGVGSSHIAKGLQRGKKVEEKKAGKSQTTPWRESVESLALDMALRSHEWAVIEMSINEKWLGERNHLS